MKKFIFIVILVSTLSFTVFSQNVKDKEIISIVKKAAEAQQNYDPQPLENVYASDYIEISPKGEIDERAKAIGFYKVEDTEKAKSQSPKYILDGFKIRNYGKFAIAITKFSFGSKTNPDQKPIDVGIVIYALRKEKGVWKIYSAQFTPFPRPQTPTKP